MSHKAYVGVLAHFQPVDCRPSTRLSQEAADELVRRMICERINQKLIRMLPPHSVFLAARPNRPACFNLPEILPPVEVGNCRFIPPPTDSRPRISSVREGWDWSQERLAG